MSTYPHGHGHPTSQRGGRAGCASSIPAELDRPAAGLPFTALPDGDVYAPEVGYALGFPVARDRATGRAWLVHCYGMVGVARSEALDSGNGSQLYVVIGHAPRHLDRNTTLVGRVVQGMEVLSTLPRGSGTLGFYRDPEQPIPIASVRLASELAPDRRPDLWVMRTDGAAFSRRIAERRTRTGAWFVEPTGRIEVCNVGVPVR